MSKLFAGSTTNQSSDGFESNFKRGFTSCLSRFEAEAAMLERGFKTALFVQRFKAGLMPASGRRMSPLP
jgi:hypothetical protein